MESNCIENTAERENGTNIKKPMNDTNIKKVQFMKPNNRRVENLQTGTEGAAKRTSSLSNSSIKKIYNDWKVIAKNGNPVRLDPTKLPNTQSGQQTQVYDTNDIITSRYCKKHFETHENTPKLKRSKTKIYVLRKGKIQEETEEKIGWIYYNKDKSKVYMNKLGSFKCPDCEKTDSFVKPFVKNYRRKSRVSTLFPPTKPKIVINSPEKNYLQLNVFSDRNSDSGGSTLPSRQLVYKDFETG
jgi:hypothetical protein